MTREQLERYFREYYPLAYRVAYTQTANHADAEDISQEVFLRLLLHKTAYESEEHEKAWMIRTTVNLSRDLLKSKWKKGRVPMEQIPEEGSGMFTVPGLEEDDTLGAVLALPGKYRDCLYLFYYEDYSIREIADILDMQENTVKTDLRRGREKLKQLLQGRRP